MQLLVIRHGLPLRSEPGQGSDPDLSPKGVEQAKRLPEALARFPITRLVSSPQRRALQTAQPVKRLISGHLPAGVDEPAFIDRVMAGANGIVADAAHEDTVALFSHGGVINALVHRLMRTEKLLCVQVDYAGITRLLASRKHELSVASINGTEHVWDLLPRNSRW